jgi:hypothetical protein
LASDEAVDASLAERERDRHAVATVHDVVAVGSRDQNNRRQRVTPAVRQRYPFPPVPYELGGGTEMGVELSGGLQRPDDRTQRDDFEVWPAPNRCGHVCECRWTAPTPSAHEPAPHPGGRVGAPGSAEVSLCVQNWISRGVSDS